ncbi:General transcriptional corepressor trfA [Spathaspora sp. JA1]|nr:General transcriptional corepressor trfA [Spathaspora sp. JA1]
MPKRLSQGSISPQVKRTQTETPASNLDNASVDAWLVCGSCAQLLGQTDTAIRSFEFVIKHDPYNVAGLCGLSSSLRLNGIKNNETIGAQSAIEKLNKAVEAFPPLSRETPIFKELAECYLMIGLNDQAHQAIQTAIQLSPHDASLWLLSAQTLIRAGARNHATGSLTHCLSILDSVKKFTTTDIETARAAHAELAAIAAADGNIEVSIAELTATLSLPPSALTRKDEHIALWCALSTAKERANDIAGAIKACEDAEMTVGNNSDRILMTHAYLLLLNVQSAGKNAQTCINLLNKIVNLETEKVLIQPNEKENVQDFLPWYLLGRAYSFMDQPRLAYDSYQVALRRAPNSPITWLAVGKLYLELKQLPDALAAYSQALRLQMDDGSQGTATAWDGLSCVYERCDDHLMDASDACTRAAACFKAIGDLKNAYIFEARAEALVQASKKEGPIPELREPPDVPSFLLRDLVALSTAERISYIQSQQQQQQQLQQQQQEQQQQQQQQQQLQQQHQEQQRAHQQPQKIQHTPLQMQPQMIRGSPEVTMVQQTPQQIPIQIYQQVPPQQNGGQYLYPLPYSYKPDQKSPRQQPHMLPQLPNPLAQQSYMPPDQSQPQLPQYLYQQGPQRGALPPVPPHAQPGGPHQSPLNHPQMVPNGTPYPGMPGAPAGYAYGPQQYVPIQGGAVPQQ